MENQHPIPKNVSGFQFKLIGEMTIKQFAYLAGNALLAYIFYVLPMPGVIKFPFVMIFLASGLVLAFIPYEGRPLERWIINFFTAVFRPNQYIFKLERQNVQTTIPPTVVQKTPLSPTTSIPPVAMPSVQATAPQPAVPEKPEKPERPAVQIPETPVLKVAAQQAKDLNEKPQVQVGETQKQNIQQQIQELIFKKIELEKQLGKVKSIQVRAMPARPAAVAKPTAPSGPRTTLPTVGNLISGSIRDSSGNILPDILAEVKDNNNNLVRAFKTNKLGQFSAATILENGTYAIDFEDPAGKYKFDSISLTLDGSVVSPLEITNVEPREQLRRQLFTK